MSNKDRVRAKIAEVLGHPAEKITDDAVLADHASLSDFTVYASGPPVMVAAGRAHFDRYLVGCTTHPAGLDFHHRCDVFQGFVESFQGIFVQTFLNDIQRTVNNSFGD